MSGLSPVMQLATLAMRPLTKADRALAAQFAGSLEHRPAARQVDELTEEQLQAIDAAMLAFKKDDGYFKRSCAAAMDDQLRANGRLP